MADNTNAYENDYDLLILNGVVVTSETVSEADIAVKDEKIAAVVPRGQLAASTAKRTIDAQGGYVMPGGVDAHVHLAVSLKISGHHHKAES
jgi:dihydropyrimidinase